MSFFAGPPGDNAIPVATNDAIMNEQIEFKCDVTDPGNPPAEVYIWEHNDNGWHCEKVADDEARSRCTVASDCSITISCEPRHGFDGFDGFVEDLSVDVTEGKLLPHDSFACACMFAFLQCV